MTWKIPPQTIGTERPVKLMCGLFFSTRHELLMGFIIDTQSAGRPQFGDLGHSRKSVATFSVIHTHWHIRHRKPAVSLRIIRNVTVDGLYQPYLWSRPRI